MEDIKSGKTTDPDPEDLAGGGLAGMLGETDRVPYQHGSRQPGMERSVNRAAREKVTRDVRNLQQQMAERGGNSPPLSDGTSSMDTAWPISMSRSSTGARNSAPCSPTKKSSMDAPNAATSRSSAGRCDSGCSASPHSPSGSSVRCSI